MNIGILTHCIANNFGANLQALSTACYLRNHGYNPIFFFWDAYLKKRSTNMDPEQLDMHRSFLCRHGFEITRPCTSDDDFISVIQEYEIHNIIVGSDAVFTVSSWIDRLKISKKGISLKPITEDKMFPNPFWVPFSDRLDNCNFFYLSPSCQSTNYKFLSRDTISKMRTQIGKFGYLSARDNSTREMIRYIMGYDIEVPLTPDPVWGFTHNVETIPSKDAIFKKYNIKKDYILVSYYSKTAMPIQWHNRLRKLANDKGFEVYSLPMPQGHFVSNLPQIQLPIDSLDWYALIKYSIGYIGNNMHPIIVAMHNIVPFFSIDQHGKSFWRFHFEKTSKVYDLLSRFGMMKYRKSFYNSDNIPPESVFQTLLSFDHEKCKEISKKMEEDYCDMMTDICKMFK